MENKDARAFQWFAVLLIVVIIGASVYCLLGFPDWAQEVELASGDVEKRINGIRAEAYVQAYPAWMLVGLTTLTALIVLASHLLRWRKRTASDTAPGVEANTDTYDVAVAVLLATAPEQTLTLSQLVGETGYDSARIYCALGKLGTLGAAVPLGDGAWHYIGVVWKEQADASSDEK